MALTHGTRFGPYEIVSQLGAGGMGEVYRARDTRLNRSVAIKVLLDSVAGDADRLARFEREARLAGALNHPHICTLHDVGEDGHRRFLVMELLEGRSLASAPRAPMPLQEIIHVGIQLADALAAAHAHGIVHRDLKPANIFITSRGDAKVLDFGVATLAQESTETGTGGANRVISSPGVAVGTYAYMAPEQLRGEKVDARADLFALGLVLYEMATGQHAFKGSTSAIVMDGLLNRAPERPRTFNPLIPERLQEILLKLLEKNRDLRYQHAVDLRADLRRLQRDGAEARPAASPNVRSVAVLPFRNMSNDPENAFFCDGIAEDLINALGRLSGLHVASRTSSFRFRGGDADIHAIGDALRVGSLLDGSVRRSGTRLRVTAQLVKVADGYQLWSERYDREMADVFDIQDDIVSSIVKALAPALLAQAEGVVRRPTDNPEAYELCLKGRHYWHLRSPGTLRLAIQSFEQAIALDPAYALAYAGLADCQGLLHAYGWMTKADSQPKTLAAVTRALELDPSLAEVQFSKALYLFYFERTWRDAETHFRKAIAANPRWSLAHLYYALLLNSSYRHDESIPEAREAVTLDPLSPFTHALAGWILTLCGRFDEGAALVHRSLDLQPEYLLGTWVLGRMFTKSGRADEAIALLERVVKVSRSPIFLGLLGEAYGVAGRDADVDAFLRELDEREARGEYIAPFSRVMLHAGRRDRAGVRDSLLACIAEDTSWFTLNVAITGTLANVAAGDPELETLLDTLYGGIRPRSV